MHLITLAVGDALRKNKAVDDALRYWVEVGVLYTRHTRPCTITTSSRIDHDYCAYSCSAMSVSSATIIVATTTSSSTYRNIDLHTTTSQFSLFKRPSVEH